MSEEQLELRIRALVDDVVASSPDPPRFPADAVAPGNPVGPHPELHSLTDDTLDPRGADRRRVVAVAAVLVVFVAGIAAAALLARGRANPTATTGPSPTQETTATTVAVAGPVLSGTTSDGRRFEVQVASTDPNTICVHVGSDDIGCSGPPVWPEDVVYVDDHGTPLVYGQLPLGAVSVTLERPDGSVITDGLQIDNQNRVWAMPIPAPESATELVKVEPLNLTVVFHLEDGTTIERRRDAG
jgi:hypothetical protein